MFGRLLRIVLLVSVLLGLDTAAGAAETTTFSPPPDTPVIPWTRFSVQYAVRVLGSSGPTRVVFYITNDGGQNWREYGEDPDMRSPMLISVPGEGTYGFVTSIATEMRPIVPPRPGTRPDRFVIVDLTPPVARWIRPAQGELQLGADGSIVLEWEASDPHMGLEPVTLEYSVDGGGSWLPLREKLPAKGSINWTPPLFEGENELILRLIAQDLAGNKGIVRNQARFSLDREPPVVSITGPAMAGGYEFPVAYSATDNRSGVGQIELYYSTDGGNEWFYYGPDNDLSQPTISFRSPQQAQRIGLYLVAADRRGNRTPAPVRGVRPMFTVELDMEAPQVTILPPFASSSTIIGMGQATQVRWSASDVNILDNSARVEYSVDGGRSWAQLAQNLPANGFYNWTPDFQAENALLKVSVSDSMGNVGTALSMPFRIDRDRPATDIRGVTPVEGDTGFPPSTPTAPAPGGIPDPWSPTVPGGNIPAPFTAPPVTEPVTPVAPVAPATPGVVPGIDPNLGGIDDFAIPGAVDAEGNPLSVTTTPDTSIAVPPVAPTTPSVPTTPTIPGFEDMLPPPATPTTPAVPAIPAETSSGADVALPPLPGVSPVTPTAPSATETGIGAMPDIPAIDSSMEPSGGIPDIGGTPAPATPTAPVAPVTPVTPTSPTIPSVPTTPAIPDIPDVDLTSVVGEGEPVARPVPTPPAVPVAVEPDAAQLLDQAEQAYAVGGQFDRAESLARQALQKDPNNPRGYALIASVLTEKERYEDALTNAEQAVKLAPGEMRYLQIYAYAQYAKANSINRAIAEKKVPENQVREFTSQSTQALDQSEQAYARMLSSSDKNEIKEAYYRLGQIDYFRATRILRDSELAAQSLRKAIVNYEKAYNLGNPDYREVLQIGICYYRLMDYDQSERWLLRAQEVAPNDRPPREAFFYLAMIYEKMERFNQALPFWRRVAELYPEGDTYRSLAESRVKALEREAGTR